MKYLSLVVLALVGLNQNAQAFTAPKLQHSLGSTRSALRLTVLDEWKLLEDGTIAGKVVNHPSYPDGEFVSTSQIIDPENANAQSVVTTISGSKYVLGQPMMAQATQPLREAMESPLRARPTAVPSAPVAPAQPAYYTPPRTEIAEEPEMERRDFLSGALIGGVGGVGIGGLLLANTFSTPMTVPEAKIRASFTGALKNADLVTMVSDKLKRYGYGKTTLVATSLCSDEVNRPLEVAFKSIYDEPFVMGGLAGFPFGGLTAFGAMAHHIPDGGSCLVVYGPHVGIDVNGSVGTVNRRGREKGGACCGSAAAALAKIKKGAMPMPAADISVPMDSEKMKEAQEVPPPDTIDRQQAAVELALAPYADMLRMSDDKPVDLPKMIYKAQKQMMEAIIAKGAPEVGDGNIAVLGGIQINTPEGISDYFLPINFDIRDNKGRIMDTFKIA